MRFWTLAINLNVLFNYYLMCPRISNSYYMTSKLSTFGFQYEAEWGYFHLEQHLK